MRRATSPGGPQLACTIRLVATTIVLVGSGFWLVVTGPAQPGPLVAVHNVSALIWLPSSCSTHSHTCRLPGALAADVGRRSADRSDGGPVRVGVNAAALLAGAGAAILVLPSDVPWVSWAQTARQAPAPLIVGTVVTIIAVIVIRPFRWE